MDRSEGSYLQDQEVRRFWVRVSIILACLAPGTKDQTERFDCYMQSSASNDEHSLQASGVMLQNVVALATGN